MVQLLDHLLNLMIENEDGHMQANASVCLKNFIKIIPDHIISQ